ncbi:MAG: hypothetical protein M0Z38_02325 [Deltaproteobacteria bacterium]|nr:hypothetical protein [Deltaproteobacteria bacterium]
MKSPSEARVIDITDEGKEAIRAVTVSLPDNARSIQVVDYVSKESANAFFLRCREARKYIATHYDPKIEAWKEAKRHADNERAKLVAEKTAAEAPIVEAEGIVNREIMRFDAEDRARREQEQRQAEEKARKEAEEAALRAAQEAEASGDKEEAAAIIEEVIAAPVFVPPPPPPPKLSGSAEVTTWKMEVTDLKALVLAVASGKAPLSYLQADEVAIRRTVTAQKGSFSCPGIKTWPETSRRSTGR